MKKLLLSVFVLTAGGIYAQSWTEQNSGFATPSRGINEIDIVDANTVWAIPYDGDGVAPVENVQEFTKTTDGGTTWTAGIVDLGDPLLAINNISAIDGQTAFISAIDGAVGGGGVYKTTDGGASWINSNPGGYISSTSFLNVVHFYDANVGISAGDPTGPGNGEFEVFKTVNGGATWTQVSSAALPNPLLDEWGYNGGNVAAGNSFWFVTNKGRIYRTTDQGVTWTAYQTPISDFSSTALGGTIYFSNNTNGVLLKRTGSGATATYTLYKTTDGGATWDAGAPYTGGDNKVLAYVPGTSTIVATNASSVGTPGSAYSSDNGTTWTTIDTGTQRGVVSFFDGSTGWAGGFNLDETSGGIYKFSGNLGLSNVADRQQISATPNPTSGMLQVSNSNANITDVVVFDILGKQVYSAQFNALNEVNLDLTPLKTGAYILKATSETGATQTLKIMKN
jgi:photosystem II stability/assembly factor-like uncharacterized protein